MDIQHRSSYIIAALLLVFMIMTRYHHFGSQLHLPDASWALFLAGGFYLKRSIYLGLFLATAGAIDYFAITQGGTSSYCISPAYVFLIPAYAALWFGGKFYRSRYQFKWSTLLPLAGTSVVAVAVCFLISNAAFYVLSGKFADLNLAEYSQRVMQYFPMFLNTTLGYIAAFSVIHSVIQVLTRSDRTDSTSPT
ncbi:MAG TPA: hypothetical protein ENJ84_13655 [Gammaproteobacteria bacterium]|nr:hypothetical protein [Gammaproteobacteria bacterium]